MIASLSLEILRDQKRRRLAKARSEVNLECGGKRSASPLWMFDELQEGLIKSVPPTRLPPRLGEAKGL